MAVSQELVAKFKADTADFDKKINGVKNSVDSVGRAGKKIGDDVSIGVNNASKSFENFEYKVKASAIAIGAAGVAIGAFSIKVGSDMESATIRIQSMLGSIEKANTVISALRNVGFETGQSVTGLAESYGKLAVFVENGSLSLQESIDISKGLTVTSLALGASSEQLSQVMFGLSQAMGSGVVRAEEFNQVTEPLPGIINRMEEATGLATGELRKMINDGQVTSEMFKNMLIPALMSFQGQTEAMADTLKVQAGIMSNTAVALGEDLYDSIAPSLSALIKLTNNFAQSFLSVKRASSDELRKRLKDYDSNLKLELSMENASLQADSVTKGIDDFLGITSARHSRIDDIVKQRKEIQEQLNKIDPVGPAFKETATQIIPAKITPTATNRALRTSRPTSIKRYRNDNNLKPIKQDEDPLFREELRDYKKDLGNFNMDAVQEFDIISQTFGDMKDSIISGFVTMSSSGKASFKDMARSIVGDLQQIITRTLLMKAVAGIGGAISGYFAPTSTPQLTASGVGFGMNGSSGFLSGARANGGFVGANRAYLVGERGPEILQMGSQSGQVISNEKSFGGSTIINIDARGATAGVEQQIKRVMGEVLNLKKQVPNIAISAVREQNSRNAGFLR